MTVSVLLVSILFLVAVVLGVLLLIMGGAFGLYEFFTSARIPPLGKLLGGALLALAVGWFVADDVRSRREMKAFQAGECLEFKALGYHTYQGSGVSWQRPPNCQEDDAEGAR